MQASDVCSPSHTGTLRGSWMSRVIRDWLAQGEGGNWAESWRISHIWTDEYKRRSQGTSLVIQWLRFHTSDAGDLGLIPGQGTRSHMLQLRVCMPPLKIPHAAMKMEDPGTKTRHSQIDKFFKVPEKKKREESFLTKVIEYRVWVSSVFLL